MCIGIFFSISIFNYLKNEKNLYLVIGYDLKISIFKKFQKSDSINFNYDFNLDYHMTSLLTYPKRGAYG